MTHSSAGGRRVWRFGLFALVWSLAASCGDRRASGSAPPPPAATTAAPAAAAPRAPLGAIKVSEAAFRREAQNAPMPTYPPSAIAKKTVGVVVLQVLATPDGKVSAVDVLEAPSAETGRAAAEAVRQWTFAPRQNDAATEDRDVKGRLTFYFSLRGGTPRVLNPSQVTTSRPAAHTPAPTHALTVPELDALRRKGDLVVLDVRERDVFAQQHLPGAINIPLGELATRAPIELKPARRTVVVCTDATLCAGAMSVLRAAGFAQVDEVKRP